MSLYLFIITNLFAGWIQPVQYTFYHLLPDEPVQFITTDNVLHKGIVVGYSLPAEGRTDEMCFEMRCDNINTSQWSYIIGDCTVESYNTYLDSVPLDKEKHWIITKTCTHLKVVCNNVTVLNFNFATDYSPGNETYHQVWLGRCSNLRFFSVYNMTNILLRTAS